MIPKGKIGLTEMFCLLFLSNISRIFLSFPQAIVEDGQSAAWLLALIGSLGSLVMFWVITLLMKKFPGKTIMEATEQVLGPYLGTLVNLSYAAYFLVVVILFEREYAEALLASALPRAPISVVIFIFFMVSLAGLFFGLEPLARTARLATPFMLAFLGLLFVAVLPQCDWHNEFPLLGPGLGPLIFKGLYNYSLLSEALLAAVFMPVFQGWPYMRKAAFYGIAAGSLLLVALMFIYQGVFTVNVASEEALPFYILSRIVYLGRFFQRVESLFLMSWSIVGMFKISITLYAGAIVLTKTLKLPDEGPLILMCAVLTFALSFLPPDFPTAALMDKNIIRTWGLLPTFGLPLLVYVFSFFRSSQKNIKLLR